MKNSFKLIALFLAIAMLAVSLCSCRALDERKENRAVYTSTEHTKIEYKGNLYRLLLNSENKDILTTGGSFVERYSSRVTDKDVPVLLDNYYGNFMDINEDETIIRVFLSSEKLWDFITDEELYYHTSVTYWGGHVYYVHEDKYEEVKEDTAPL